MEKLVRCVALAFDERIRRPVSLGLFVGLLIYFLRKSFDLPKTPSIAISVIIFIALYCLGIGKSSASKRSVYFLPLITFPLLLLGVFAGIAAVFDRVDVGAIIFHVTAGIGEAGVADFYEDIVKFAALTGLLIWSAHYLIRRDSRMRKADKFLVLPLLLCTPLTSYFLVSAVYASADADALSRYYMAPTFAPLGAKQEKKNLLIIYAESTELTFAELGTKEPIFDDMKHVASLGTSVTGIGQVENTSWTLAGIVASQCGVPLQPLGLLERNQFQNQKQIVPGVKCLGDILKDAGYRTEYLGGASPSFAGKGTFLRGHGYDRVRGREDFEAQVGDYINTWGLFDDTVFAEARKTVRQLQAGNQPFLFSLLTVGAHTPDGYPSKECLDHFGPIKFDQILYSVRCTGFHIRSFLSKLDAEGLLENTIVVMSDHLSMKDGIWDEAEIGKRHNYFTMLRNGVAASTIEKTAVSFDVFPTLLEVLGFNVPDGRAGLGVSLFSSKPSLLKQLGRDGLNRLIVNDDALRRRMWNTATN